MQNLNKNKAANYHKLKAFVDLCRIISKQLSMLAKYGKMITVYKRLLNKHRSF